MVVLVEGAVSSEKGTALHGLQDVILFPGPEILLSTLVSEKRRRVECQACEIMTIFRSVVMNE